MPGSPPPGTDFVTVLANYPQAFYVGLFQGNPSVCPPAPFAAIVQPTYRGYSLLPAVDWRTLDVPAGSNQAARRFQATFAMLGPNPPVTVTGWFAVVRYSDGSYATALIQYFPAPLVLTYPTAPQTMFPEAAGNALTVNTAVGAASVGVGQDVVSVASFASIEQNLGGKMYVFRGEQRRCIQTAIAGLRQILSWDGNLANLSPNSILAPFPILPTIAYPSIPLPPDTNGYRQCATDVIAALQTDLTLVK